MLAGGNGLVPWAELELPSSIAAVLVALMPLWLTLMDRRFCNGPAITPLIWLGMAMGVAGVVMLAAPGGHGGGEGMPVWPLVAMIAATVSWAIGSLRARTIDRPKSSFLSLGMQMAAGGAVMMVAGTFLGEWVQVDVAAMSAKSIGAFVYLVTFGSIVALAAYMYLLENTTAAAVSTYAFVNPVVAVILGWALGGETFTSSALLASALIVGGVIALQTSRAREARKAKARRAVQPPPVARMVASGPRLAAARQMTRS